MRHHQCDLLQDKRDTAPLTSYYQLLQASTALFPHRAPYVSLRQVNSVQGVQVARGRHELGADLERVRKNPNTMAPYI